ncbi:hypothetical protein EDC01DRAFT_136217 [Geopyxis carbonaria]|nr:hypothetical protein EDC01DRAFT_136217 [Geopyxis carbonaria]
MLAFLPLFRKSVLIFFPVTGVTPFLRRSLPKVAGEGYVLYTLSTNLFFRFFFGFIYTPRLEGYWVLTTARGNHERVYQVQAATDPKLRKIQNPAKDSIPSIKGRTSDR